MILFCRYGVDASAPEKGFIVAHYDDGAAPDTSKHPGTLIVPDVGPAERFGRFGPAPQLMGDVPTGLHPCREELDEAKLPHDHYLRGPCNAPLIDLRRPEMDMRPWAAPDLTVDLARAAKTFEMDAAFAAAAVGGFASEVLEKDKARVYPSDADGERKLQMAALAALSGQHKAGWTATLRCAEPRCEPVGLPHDAAQVHGVLADYQAFVDALHAERDAVAARIAAVETVPDILAITRG